MMGDEGRWGGGCFKDIPRKKEKNTSYYFLCDGDYQTDYDNLTQIEENISVAPPTLKKLYKLTDKLNQNRSINFRKLMI